MLLLYFVTTFLSAVGSVSPIKALRLKSHTEPRFDTDVLNAIWNCDKHHKNPDDQATVKTIVNIQTFQI